MQKRRRFKQQLNRLASWSKQAMAMASALPLGAERDAMLKKARQA